VGYFEELRSVDLQKLSDIALREHFEEYLYRSIRVWRRGHWIPFYASFNIYLRFENMCEELFGFSDADPRFKSLMSGFDSRVYQSDHKLWEISNRVKELDLEKIVWEITDDVNSYRISSKWAERRRRGLRNSMKYYGKMAGAARGMLAKSLCLPG